MNNWINYRLYVLIIELFYCFEYIIGDFYVKELSKKYFKIRNKCIKRNKLSLIIYIFKDEWVIEFCLENIYFI